jgi:hypothetical protein
VDVAARRWQKHDIVLRLEEDANGNDVHYVYKVVAVSKEHKDVSDNAHISCQLFLTKDKKHKLTDMVWNNFKACELSNVPVDAFESTGSMKSCTKNKLTLTFDPQAFYDAQVVAEGGEEEGHRGGNEEKDEVVLFDGEGDDEEKEEAAVEFDPLNMEDVAKQLPDFKKVRSMLQCLVEDRGHMLALSPKYHAELAGQGVEYDFGRTKWWFRSHNSHSTAGLRAKSLESFSASVVTLAHTRKFARRARDYMRAYQRGHKGLEVELATKKYKCHRSALDPDYHFVTEAKLTFFFVN